MPKCANCGKRPGTETWVGNGGVMDWVHGNYAMWCSLCVVEAQIAHAEKMAADLPALKQLREELRAADAVGQR